ncbi:histidine kinase, partial [Pseudoalteromonas sp. Isolate3]|nr:histidine kinase [Pseudoalteromonas sp. Isolate3]
MLAAISYLSSTKNTKSMVALLPLIAAILLESHIRYLSLRIDSPGTYLTVNLQLIFECIPFLIAHWIASQHSLKQASLWWLSGFIGYPIITYLLSNGLPTYDKWHYLQEQCWLLCSLASLFWLSSQRFKKNQKSKFTSWISSLFTLNKVVFFICFAWAFIMAGILNSHESPLLNQPFALIFDTQKLLTNYYQFIWYFSQLLVYAIIVHGIFLFNRYILIRQLLARHGVLIFVSACLISMVIFTPLLVAIVLTLPVNDLPSYVANLTPGGSQNIINKYNYQFMFLFLSISTPII